MHRNVSVAGALTWTLLGQLTELSRRSIIQSISQSVNKYTKHKITNPNTNILTLIKHTHTEKPKRKTVHL